MSVGVGRTSLRWLALESVCVVVACAITSIGLVNPAEAASRSELIPVRSVSAPSACTPVKFVGVRGSGEQGDPRQLGELTGPLYDALVARFGDRAIGFYGLPYPAHAIDWRVFESYNVTYQRSKNRGRDELRDYLRAEVAACASERLLVVGYSQGAHVVGDVFSKKVGQLSPNVLGKVSAVELFGDPRFNSRESFDRGSFTLGRNGLLGARSPEDLDSVSTKLRSWCRQRDLVCQGPGDLSDHAASKYLRAYRDSAVHFLVSRVERIITNASPRACLSSNEATRLFQASPAQGKDGTETIDSISCVDNWAEGTIVDQDQGVGSAAFRRRAGEWRYVTSAGLYSLFCDELRSHRAPSALVSNCPAPVDGK